MSSKYQKFLESKDDRNGMFGFKPTYMPEAAFDFQEYCIDWAVRKGRGLLMEQCGLGKTLQELAFAQNVVEHTNRPVLITMPLAVAHQTLGEARKFGLRARITRDGKVHKGINLTNYEQIHKYSPNDFAALVGDEISICKNVDGKTRQTVTKFMTKVPYALGATATPAPNDYMELGTLSEALGVMPYGQMLGMFFTNTGESTQSWELKGHAKKRFWRWMASWSRAIRSPADLGFDDTKYRLPPLNIVRHTVPSSIRRKGLGIVPTQAVTLEEQRRERKGTLKPRCELTASLISKDKPCVCWVDMNAEGDLLTQLIPGAIQVSGADSDEYKEWAFTEFSAGNIRVLVTKAKIGGFGMNWQHCAETTHFPTHSFEKWYQTVHRFLRFGQLNPVTDHMIFSDAEEVILRNWEAKTIQAEAMYDGMVNEMHKFQMGVRDAEQFIEMRLPTWLAS